MKIRRRLIVHVLVFVALGAIVNVAVAWGCGASLDVAKWKCDQKERGVFSTGPGQWWSYVKYSGRGAAKCLLSPLPASSIDPVANGPLPPTWAFTNTLNVVNTPQAGRYVIADAKGWPAIGLHCEVTIDYHWSLPQTATYQWGMSASGGMLWNRGFLRNAPASGTPDQFVTAIDSVRTFPLLPIWPGFAINTVFYATTLWLVLFAPGKLRRWQRSRRGLCPACEYPIGASEVCTECGAAVRTATA